MKIAFFGLEKKDQSTLLESFNNNAEVSFFEEKLDASNIDKAKDAEVISIFINSEISKSIIDALPALKFIATRSTGFDHIDCEYAKAKGIKVSNVSAYGSHTVAEFAFGLIANLAKNIGSANNYIRETLDFNYSSGMVGFDLQGKTIGIVGTGKIGKNVVKIARGFEMNIIAYDLFPDVIFSQANNFEYRSLDEVISQSDIITLHAPYTKENHHLINREKIGKMKRGVYLINTARGELVDTEALVFGLREGIIAGVGADVLEGERKLKDEKNLLAGGKLTEEDKKIISLNHELMKMPNVIITPHIAFYTREAIAEILRITAENIKGYISGTPINLVN
jgi:D-lactate dehydrogenase